MVKIKLYLSHSFFKNIRDKETNDVVLDISSLLKEDGVIALCPVFLKLEDFIKYHGENVSYTILEVDNVELAKFIS